MPENEEVAPTAEAQQDVAHTDNAKTEATSTAKASDELSEDDLEAVAGGRNRYGNDTIDKSQASQASRGSKIGGLIGD
jgi:hypothetical protein